MESLQHPIESMLMITSMRSGMHGRRLPSTTGLRIHADSPVLNGKPVFKQFGDAETRMIYAKIFERVRVSGQPLEREITSTDLFSVQSLPKISHGMCPDCAKSFLADVLDRRAA